MEKIDENTGSDPIFSLTQFDKMVFIFIFFFFFLTYPYKGKEGKIQNSVTCSPCDIKCDSQPIELPLGPFLFFDTTQTEGK
jgi:hypothetical protein